LSCGTAVIVGTPKFFLTTINNQICEFVGALWNDKRGDFDVWITQSNLFDLGVFQTNCCSRKRLTENVIEIY
jgi:hypothetical protein